MSTFTSTDVYSNIMITSYFHPKGAPHAYLNALRNENIFQYEKNINALRQKKFFKKALVSQCIEKWFFYKKNLIAFWIGTKEKFYQSSIQYLNGLRTEIIS